MEYGYMCRSKVFRKFAPAFFVALFFSVPERASASDDFFGPCAGEKANTAFANIYTSFGGKKVPFEPESEEPGLGGIYVKKMWIPKTGKSYYVRCHYSDGTERRWILPSDTYLCSYNGSPELGPNSDIILFACASSSVKNGGPDKKIPMSQW